MQAESAENRIIHSIMGCYHERGISIMKVRISSIASALFSPLRNRPVYLNSSQGIVLPKSQYSLQQLAASLKCDRDNLVPSVFIAPMNRC